MVDVAILWDNTRGYGDWSFTHGDLVTTSGLTDLENAVALSLFTDRRADESFVPWDGDRRGWWGDTYLDSPVGSRLWQLERAKKVGNTQILLLARDYCKEALQPLIDGGIVGTVNVSTQWISPTAIGILVTLTEPAQSDVIAFNYSYAWAPPADTSVPVGIAQEHVVPPPVVAHTLGSFILGTDKLS